MHTRDHFKEKGTWIENEVKNIFHTKKQEREK